MELGLTLGIGLADILFTFYLTYDFLQRDPGAPEMQHLSSALKEGEEAFLQR